VIGVRPADAAGVAAAVEALARGRLVLHPTETLVSLTGDAWSAEAARAARTLKGYDEPRPFLCLVADPAAARALAAEWPAAAERLAAALWPGPLTLVVRAAAEAPEPVVAGGTIAIRPAAHPVARALVVAWGGPLFSTSANRRGEPAPTLVEEAARSLEAGGDMVALGLVDAASAPERGSAAPRTPGGAGPAPPSTIVDVSGRPRLARAGAIPAERIREIVPELA